MDALALRLDYFFDPFCGWCYASAPALKAVAEAFPEASVLTLFDRVRVVAERAPPELHGADERRVFRRIRGERRARKRAGAPGSVERMFVQVVRRDEGIKLENVHRPRP